MKSPAGVNPAPWLARTVRKSPRPRTMAAPSPEQQLIALVDRIAARRPDGGRPADCEAALRELYDLTSARLYGVALRIVTNRDWAEDVLQEAYLNIWRIAGDYRASLSPPLGWMGVIVRSRALDFLRRRASERADVALDLDAAVSETVAGDSPDPLDTSQASEQAWALHECLRKLEARQREVVSLAYLRDLSHGELAAQLLDTAADPGLHRAERQLQLRGCMARFA
jgi:RNA polymerase sigma factor (sigma-70 family)